MTDRERMNGLNASNKPGREALAQTFCAVAKLHGAMIERRDERAVPGFSGQGIHLAFAVGGVGASLSLSSLHGGDRGLISWHNDYGDGHRRARDFSSLFNAAVGECSGRRHHKATTCCNDWAGLAMALDRGLCSAARGEAFEPSDT